MGMFDFAARLTVPVGERDHIQGRFDAPVTLVEYADYACPACAAAYPLIKEVQALLGDRLRFVFRNFPVEQLHRHAGHAAEAAEAVGLQGPFWTMQATLFAHQDRLDDASLQRYAATVGVDMERFVQDFTTGFLHRRVRGEYLGGTRSGVTKTPTFFINERRYDGALDGAALIAAIETAEASFRP
jgi:protein-disulfide isomerase